MPGKARENTAAFVYEGFNTPNGTFVPDDVFDLIAPRLTEAELRVLLYIVRRTFGFAKNADAISLRQLTDGITARDGRILDHGTGMSRKGVIGGIKGLQQKGIIHVHKQVDPRGDSEINVYSLRFREGVVTESNYPGNPKSLPLVTKGNPQESALQEPVKQQPPSPDFNPAGEPVVASDAQKTPSESDERLYEALKDLGIHHHTASKLLRAYDHEHIDIMCAYVSDRLAQGWAPQESVAAWLVAAIKGKYKLPAGYQTPREREQRRQEEDAHHQRLSAAAVEAERQAEAETARQRAGRLLSLGIEQSVDKVWQEVQALLRQRGEWSVVMALAYLKHIEGGLAILLAPESVRRRLGEHAPAIATALAEISGHHVEVVVQTLQ